MTHRLHVPGSRTLEPQRLIGWLLGLATFLLSTLAQADVGVQLGPHAGAVLGDSTRAYAGAGLRLTAPSSPLTLQPTFDYVFDEKQTLYHVAGNVLFEAPLAFRLKPYVGIGANLSAFALKQQSMTGDGEGYRLGLNLVAGARLELPWLSPFVQVKQSVGELDAFAVGGGLELRLRERSGARSALEPMRFAATPYLANHVAGDVQSGRLGLGLSLAFFPWAHFGFELDGQLHGHFFRDEDVADLAPEGVDLNTAAALVSASGVFRYCVSDAVYGAWCPYAAAGFGAIHAWFDGSADLPGVSSFSKAQTDPALAVGGGLTHLFTQHVGVRVDARYLHAFVDESATAGGYFEDYGFLRLSAGVSVGF